MEHETRSNKIFRKIRSTPKVFPSMAKRGRDMMEREGGCSLGANTNGTQRILTREGRIEAKTTGMGKWVVYACCKAHFGSWARKLAAAEWEIRNIRPGDFRRKPTVSALHGESRGQGKTLSVRGKNLAKKESSPSKRKRKEEKPSSGHRRSGRSTVARSMHLSGGTGGDITA